MYLLAQTNKACRFSHNWLLGIVELRLRDPTRASALVGAVAFCPIKYIPVIYERPCELMDPNNMLGRLWQLPVFLEHCPDPAYSIGKIDDC